ncbi:hypothetical protein KBD71_00855 [Candidatus Woesebacteria bacterium]|nr:hypothetical protein [Candidatus Woesebacteria bacterium]
MKTRSLSLYWVIVLIGLLPTIGVFAWGVYTSVTRSSVPFTTPFSSMM